MDDITTSFYYFSQPQVNEIEICPFFDTNPGNSHSSMGSGYHHECIIAKLAWWHALLSQAVCHSHMPPNIALKNQDLERF